jgi:hypothetical protein
MLKLLAVLIPTALWFSPAPAADAILLSATKGVRSSVAGSVSGEQTLRYNLSVLEGQSVSIELSSELLSSCSLRIVELPSALPLFEASSGQSIYRDAGTSDRTLQVVAYPSRDAFIGNIPCHYAIAYDVN